MGVVTLADGNGNGEFGVLIDVPEWSNIRFVPRKDGSVAVHTKIHMKSSRHNTERTINAIFNLQGQMEHTYMLLAKMTEEFKKHVEIEEDEGKIIPGKFGDYNNE